jgi:hypothetical protein
MKKDLVVYKPKTPAIYKGIGRSGKPKTSFAQTLGKKFGSFAKMGKGIVKKGIKFGTIGAVITGAAYIAGAGTRKYNKAPKVGEGRNLRNSILSKPDKRQRY